MKVALLSFFMFVALSVHANVKDEIARLELMVAEEDTGILHAELARTYLKDQDQQRAFSQFLIALEKTTPAPLVPIQEEDQLLYDEALKVYLGDGKSREIAKELKERYSAHVEEHQDWRLLTYLVSIAYANLGDYETFFRNFYLVYPYLSDHYLAHKTKAVLHIKLYERAGTIEDKERERRKILASAIEAQERNPNDTVLYKWILTFSRAEDRPQLVTVYLQKIIEQNILIPRADIGFYVQKAIETNQLPLAELFVGRAREWYQFSRVVSAAQQYLDQKKRQL